MTNNIRQLPLKPLLVLDAATCAAMSVVLLFGSVPIAEATNISSGLLFWAGASLVPVAAFMAATSRTTRVPGWAGSLVVLGNLLWIAASLLLPAAGLISPNPLGWAFLAAQAGAVAILTWLEFGALRGQAAIN